MRSPSVGMLLPRRPDPGAACAACGDLPDAAAGGTLARPLEVAVVMSPGEASDPDARTGAGASLGQTPGVAPTVSYQPVSGAWSLPSYAELPLCRHCLNTARLLPSAVRGTQLCLCMIGAPIPEVIT